MRIAKREVVLLAFTPLEESDASPGEISSVYWPEGDTLSLKPFWEKL